MTELCSPETAPLTAGTKESLELLGNIYRAYPEVHKKITEICDYLETAPIGTSILRFVVSESDEGIAKVYDKRNLSGAHPEIKNAFHQILGALEGQPVKGLGEIEIHADLHLMENRPRIKIFAKQIRDTVTTQDSLELKPNFSKFSLPKIDEIDLPTIGSPHNIINFEELVIPITIEGLTVVAVGTGKLVVKKSTSRTDDNVDIYKLNQSGYWNLLDQSADTDILIVKASESTNSALSTLFYASCTQAALMQTSSHLDQFESKKSAENLGDELWRWSTYKTGYHYSKVRDGSEVLTLKRTERFGSNMFKECFARRKLGPWLSTHDFHPAPNFQQSRLNKIISSIKADRSSIL